MFIFFLAIFLTGKLVMTEEESKLEQKQQKEAFIAGGSKKLYEQIN